MSEPTCQAQGSPLERMVRRFRAWVCRKVGHSFSNVALLMFKIESEGRRYTTNLITGECKPSTRTPEITCRRCGVRLVGEAPNESSSATGADGKGGS